MTALTVPALIEEIIQRYDAKVEPFTEFNVGGELNEARRALIDATELENLGAWSEVLAFGLATGATKTLGIVTSGRWGPAPMVPAR
jgi:hypothetical protein